MISEAGSIEDAMLTQWRACRAAEAVLLDELEKGEARDVSIIRSMVHAISQGTTAYAKLIEAGEFEARISELEAAVTTRPAPGRSNGKRAYA